LLAGAAAVSAQPKSDWEREQEERNWREAEAALPAFPQQGNWGQFYADAASGFRFYVDRSSIAVGPDRIVRFALLALSPLGPKNISFEGLRCDKREHRIYAIGRTDGSWSRREGSWRLGMQRWQIELRAEFFCPKGFAIASPAEGVDALRRGGHPNKEQHSHY